MPINTRPIDELLKLDLNRLRIKDGHADDDMHLQLVTQLDKFFSQFKKTLTEDQKNESSGILKKLFKRLTEVEYNYTLKKCQKEFESAKLEGLTGVALLKKFGAGVNVINQFEKTTQKDQDEFLDNAINQLNRNKAFLCEINSLDKLKKRMQYWGSEGFGTDIRIPQYHKKAINALSKYERLYSKPCSEIGVTVKRDRIFDHGHNENKLSGPQKRKNVRQKLSF